MPEARSTLWNPGPEVHVPGNVILQTGDGPLTVLRG